MGKVDVAHELMKYVDKGDAKHIMIAAARVGDLNMIREMTAYLKELPSDKILKKAVNHRHKDIIKYMLSEGYYYPSIWPYDYVSYLDERHVPMLGYYKEIVRMLKCKGKRVYDYVGDVDVLTMA